MSQLLSPQAAQQVVMVRPHHFQSNPETMADNAFQRSLCSTDSAFSAFTEVTEAVAKLRSYGVKVHLFEDLHGHTPDSVFPNNWFSCHHNGLLVSYPMYAANRRLEYRQDIMDFMLSEYNFGQVLDLRGYAEQQQYLEGTGAIVFDHIQRRAYVCRSKRADESLLKLLCRQLNYQAVIFDAFDSAGVAVYHTNVLMCVGSKFVLMGTDMVAAADRQRLIDGFAAHQQQLINLSEQQIAQFCGNAIELQGDNGPILALSATAYQALTSEQVIQLEQFVELVPLQVPTIESAGGSVRCMIAGIHHPGSPR